MPALATDKYPPTIKKLFAPRPPLLHVPPLDYPPEKRSTKPVSPVSKWKEIYQEHAQRIREENETTDTAVETTLQKQAKARAKRERAQAESFQRQMEEWLDPSLAEKHEKEVMKDPYCTLFIARLDYDVTEVEVSQSFSRFGAIASIRIIRDNEGGSMVPPAYGQPAAPAYGLTMAYGLYRAAAPETSVRDKYAKYGTSSTTSYRPASNLRSVRNIRRE